MDENDGWIPSWNEDDGWMRMRMRMMDEDDDGWMDG